MIRYVIALTLVVTVLGLTGAALDHASALRGEQAVETEIAAIEAAAMELFALETAGQEGRSAKRVIEIDLPQPTLTTDGMETLRFERAGNADTTRVTYAVDGRTERTTTIDAPLADRDGGVVDLSDQQGSQRLILRLQRDADGDPVVTVSPG